MGAKMKITYTVPEFQCTFDPDTEVFCQFCGNIKAKPQGCTLQTLVTCEAEHRGYPYGVPMSSMEEACSLAEDYPWYRERFDANELNEWCQRAAAKETQ